MVLGYLDRPLWLKECRFLAGVRAEVLSRYSAPYMADSSFFTTLGAFASLLVERRDELWLRTGEHLLLTAASTGLALSIGLPLGLLASKVKSLRGLVMGLMSVFQTIPSLALLAFLLAIFGEIGTKPALVALTLYALLPIVRNTVTGLQGVNPAVLDAARGIGMSERQKLFWVELPLAAPVILAGLRTSLVVGVGVATLAAFIGAGGLGQFIYRGLSLSNTPMLLLGAIPTALLALVADAALGVVEIEMGRRTGRKPTPRSAPRKFFQRALVLVSFLFAASCLGSLLVKRMGTRSARTVRIGSQNFTEQIILGEIMAQRIEDATDIRVERALNMGATMIAHNALIDGAIDMYPEYTGTSLMAVLKLPPESDAQKVFQKVSKRYREDFACEWLPSFGFENTYVISVPSADARRNSWKTISDLSSAAPNLRAGFVAEFMEREDGWPGLRDTYGLKFRKISDIDTNLMYPAIAAGEVDVVCNYSTDGRILVYDLTPLKDDKEYFPPYECAPVLRQDTLNRFPELRIALAPLAGAIDEAAMQKMNYQVDQEKQSPAAVAKAWLLSKGLGKQKP